MRVRLLIVLSLLALSPFCVGAADPRSQPVLRIETGGHGAGVGDAATDAAGRILVTVSDDKTARVWSLPDLEPLFVIRPDIGPGLEGALYAAAVSPDGRYIAVGGARPEVLLFDSSTKELARRWTALPAGVLSLAFSADGARLAAGFGKGGLRAWNVQSGDLAFQDADYEKGIYGIAFAKDGRLVASTIAGTLQLYDSSGKSIKKVATDVGHSPFQVRFNPAGNLVAVGFADAFATEVRDGATLAIKTKPSLGAVKGRSLTRLNWSADGKTLFAAGNGILVGNTHPFWAWANGGAGEPRKAFSGFPDSAAAVLPLPDGHFVGVSRQGDMAVVAPSGKPDADRRFVGQDLSVAGKIEDPTRQFRVSADGKRVQWMPFDPTAATNPKPRWLSFDADSLTLSVSGSPRSDAANWSTDADGLKVTDWDGGLAPKLNDRPLPLNPSERAQSASARGRRVVLGTNFGVRAFDAAGQQAWFARTAEQAYRVAQSGDDRLVVAALNSGAIRWYRAADGVPVLTLFVTADGDRWIAYTPQGYYAASPGGEDLIGWHLGNGPDQLADFFGASRLRDRFYRPDVVSRTLLALDPMEALAQINAQKGSLTSATAAEIDSTDLPPVIRIVSPADGTVATTEEVVVAYALRSPSGRPVEEITALVDGRPAESSRNLAPSVPGAAGGTGQRGLGAPGVELGEARGRIAVAVPAGQQVTISLIAETANHRQSEPASVRVTGRSASRQVQPATKRLNAVLVGVSDYPDPAIRLKYAAKDVNDIAKVLETQRGAGLYNELTIKVLTDEAATRQNIIKALNWLKAETKRDDTGIVFLSGHGIQEEGSTYFVTYDTDLKDLEATSVTQANLKSVLSKVPGRVVAFVDICHAGASVLQQGGSTVVDMTSFVNVMREPGTGLIVFASATSYQPAQESDKWQNGAFTSALKEGLMGKADLRGKGEIRTDGLNFYLNERVSELTEDQQHPIMQRPGDLQDFPLFAHKK